MNWRRSGVIALNELRILRSEAPQMLSLLVMPLLMIAFLSPALSPALHLAGVRSNGSGQAVPGMVTMFSFFATSMVSFAIFREHGWRTWDRLRASQARTLEILVGKTAPVLAMTFLQQVLLFVLGVVVFGLVVHGAVFGIVLICVAMTICYTSIGLLMAAIFKSGQQLNMLSNMASFAFAGLGGAFTPINVLPHWARAIAPATPTYWSMRGFNAVILHGEGVASTLLPIGVLAAFTAGCLVLAATRFRVDEAKHMTF